MDGLPVSPFDVRTMLQRQLALEWRFASDFVLDRIDPELALWQPVATSPTIHRVHGGWRADWPDEDADEVPAPAGIGWVLWHIEWWWSATLASVHAMPSCDPEDFVATLDSQVLRGLKAQWDLVLTGDDLDRPVEWLLPEPQPLGFIAAWVNFELAKNLAEINQLAMLRSSR